MGVESSLRLLLKVVVSLRSRTERPVESSLTVHVLSVHCLLLFPHTVDVVSRHFGILRAPEFRKTHGLAHQCLHFIFFDRYIRLQLHRVLVSS
jgi:hypothetical protein